MNLVQKYIHNQPFPLESGAILPRVEIAYHTYGKLNAAGDNVIWVCHALTANSDVADWWSGLFGEGKPFDPSKYFIVCANILGSCYGSSSLLTENPETGKSYFASFPMVTIRDMVKAHQLLQTHLGVKQIALGMGGSMGGYQLMEWAISDQTLFRNLCLLVTSSKASAWEIAIHEAQRLAIEADQTWKDETANAGSNGLKAARGIGMLTYRNYEAFKQTQEDNEEKLEDFRASSYIRYQGEKLVKRFNAQSYYLLTKAMDSHHLGRGRNSLEDALNQISSKTLVIGVDTDILCPVSEQEFITKHIPNARLEIISSPFGHDGFLVETEKVHSLLANFLSSSD
ncbi:MAG: homoserine O-acetyltransferase [Flavobacteriales bacterium]|nr:homoserine O-acetyltransferase [Flavobacteriales bacterium]